jgi:hypothetical protein
MPGHAGSLINARLCDHLCVGLTVFDALDPQLIQSANVRATPTDNSRVARALAGCASRAGDAPAAHIQAERSARFKSQNHLGTSALPASPDCYQAARVILPSNRRRRSRRTRQGAAKRIEPAKAHGA